MSLQYISDSEGKVTGVYIPIAEWEKIKNKYKEIEEIDIPEWQMNEVRDRISNYEKDPSKAMDFDEAMNDIEKDL
mgnify:CR=1 FL=1